MITPINTTNETPNDWHDGPLTTPQEYISNESTSGPILLALLDEVNKSVSALDESMNRLEDHLDAGVARIDAKLDTWDRKLKDIIAVITVLEGSERNPEDIAVEYTCI